MPEKLAKWLENHPLPTPNPNDKEKEK